MIWWRTSLVGFLASILIVVGVAPVAALDSKSETPPVAYLLVDNDTSKVLASNNEHAVLPPASITKLLTALVAVKELSQDRKITISAAAAGMPAMKINAKAGEQWTRDDLLHALLMVSANDAAVALAEATGGSLQGFSAKRVAAAHQLGLSDNPILMDPAGLDDSTFSNDGGDRISAYDMAIVARAALAEPLISSIVATPKYRFTGPDGVPHTLTNHNKMLTTYAGAIGMKTGYTRKAKNTFVGAATRDGRTMLVVVMGAGNPYSDAVRLLDQGFATPVSAEPGSAQRLPVTSTSSGLESAPVLAATSSLLSAKNITRGGFIVLLLAFVSAFAWILVRRPWPKAEDLVATRAKRDWILRLRRRMTQEG